VKWVRKSPVYTEGFEEKGESEPWDWKKEYSLIGRIEEWVKNVKKQERK